MTKETIERIRRFTTDREWQQYHTPANLAKSISIEAAELLECFQWNNDFDKEHLCEELADVLSYCIMLADRLDVDIEEIVLDKLFVRTLKARFPHLDITVMVRGGDVSNDALMEDAEYVGLTRETRVISSGKPIAGTVPDMLSDEAREALDRADVILAKGQGNYETLSGWGYHVFYAFLCKCEAFTTLFGVPELTGMLIEENRNPENTENNA